MEKTDYTMKEIVELINNSEGEIIIHVNFGEEELYGE